MSQIFSRSRTRSISTPTGPPESGSSNADNELRPPLRPTSSAEIIAATPPPLRIRRLPSTGLYDQAILRRIEEDGDGTAEGNRRRSLSEPRQRPAFLAIPSQNDIRRQRTVSLSPIQEAQVVGRSLDATLNESTPSQGPAATPLRPTSSSAHPESQTPSGTIGRRRAMSAAARSILRRQDSRISTRSRRSSNATSQQQQEEYDREVVDLLDVIDPEVSTLTSLNNIQNSLFIPYLGRYFNRTPTYDLTRTPTVKDEVEIVEDEAFKEQLTPVAESAIGDDSKRESTGDDISINPRRRSQSITSVMKEERYAVLPHGVKLPDWSEEDLDELNDYVRHALHSKRAGFKRSMKGFWRYFRTPLGFFVTTYAFLITFWGAAWVIFLIGWINVGDRREYFIEICDQILTAMLCVFGIGLAPFRCVDTYHMGHIAYYHRLTWKLRKQRELPDLKDPNDLPVVDSEAAHHVESVDAVLTPKQQSIFAHHQAKFAKAHTYYRPHETYTHRAFPLWCLITVVALLDAHSCFQIALGGTTWGIYYKKRGHILTTVILCFSLTCNITGGIMVSVGDKQTRKKEIKEQMFRQLLTQEALQRMKKKHNKEWVETAEPEEKPKKKHFWSRKQKQPTPQQEAASTVAMV